MENKITIIGAGLSGLIAGSIFPQATIFEAGPRSRIQHKAVLRFRSKAVADATGIEFRQVRVHKGLHAGGKFCAPDIRLANLYSQKVIGKLADRSIWNMEASDRFIAPENFIEQLIDAQEHRIKFEAAHDFSGGNIISTAPMPVMLKSALPELLVGAPEFKHEGINVSRFRIAGADVFQTIYFPEHDTPVYRASITGDLLIVESVEDKMMPSYDLMSVLDAFGLGLNSVEVVDHSKQSFGKIAKIDDAWRKRTILRASVEKGIYSVGRYAIWKNILLDDVVHDLAVVKKLMKQGQYEKVLKNQ